MSNPFAKKKEERKFVPAGDAGEEQAQDPDKPKYAGFMKRPAEEAPAQQPRQTEELAQAKQVAEKSFQDAAGGQEVMSMDKLRQLIDLLAGSKDNAIYPTMSYDENRISYPMLAQIGEDERDTALLDNLASASVNILEKAIYEKIAVCPDHPEFLASSVRIYCSACGSKDVVKLHLMEHKVCGYIAEKKDFEVSATGDVTKCPSCKNVIKDPKKEIRLPGMWYECTSCKGKLDNPVMKLHCRKFDHDFELNNAILLVIPYYKLKKDTKAVHLDIYSVLSQTKQLLVSHGFVVEESSSVQGKSGISHAVSLYAYNTENKTVLIDVQGSETGIDDQEVFATLVKVLDIIPTIAIFIGIPSVSERARAMAAAHNIPIVSGKNFHEIQASLEQILTRNISAPPPNTVKSIE